MNNGITTPMLSVFAGRDCIGFIIRRNKYGHEAFRVDGSSIGIFASADEAANAIGIATGEAPEKAA
jgi:hypothetical protein